MALFASRLAALEIICLWPRATSTGIDVCRNYCSLDRRFGYLGAGAGLLCLGKSNSGNLIPGDVGLLCLWVVSGVRDCHSGLVRTPPLLNL